MEIEDRKLKNTRPEDVKKCRDLAQKLRNTPSKEERMNMQQAFVKEMGERYGRDYACRMLTRIWHSIGRAEKAEQNV